MTKRADKGQELSRSELDLLKLFWRTGKLSAREVHERLESERGWAYTTTRTTLDRMAKKGLLSKIPFHGLFLYDAAVSKVGTLARLIKEFTHRVLELDSVPVASLLSQSEMLDDDELAELERLLAKNSLGENPVAERSNDTEQKP